MKDLRSRLAESPSAAARPLPHRRAYQAHPFLMAGIPVLVGIVLWLSAARLGIPIMAVSGIGIAAFGLFLEALNLIDWTWRRAQRRHL